MPRDAAERQADRVADVVAGGGSVRGWSLASVPLRAGVHRQVPGTAPTNEEKLKEAAKKAGEAARETPGGKKLQEQVKDLPAVRAVTDFVGTGSGKAVAGGAAAAGIAALVATKQPLPFQAPAIPLDSLVPGLSAKITVEGPLNAPTFAGLSFTYKEQVPKSGGPSGRASTSAGAGSSGADFDFRPQSEKDREKADDAAAVARWLGRLNSRWGVTVLLPLDPATRPKTVVLPELRPAEEKRPDDSPVQREPARHDDDITPDTSGVDAAVRSGGRPLDAVTRLTMETRFGHDFRHVRIHDDATAAGAAAGLRAKAFTVCEHIVLAAGQHGSSTAAGRHLLAHELAHVVQQGGDGSGQHRTASPGSAGGREGRAEATSPRFGDAL